MLQALKGDAKRHYKPFVLLTLALLLVHLTTSLLRLTAYENTDFTETNLIFNYFDLVDKEWSQAPILNLRLTRDQCADPAFERTWHGTKSFSYTTKKKGKKKGGQKTVEVPGVPSRTSSIFTDNVRFCKEVLKEPFSELAFVKS